MSDGPNFEQRVLSRRVDLIRRIENGLPPIEYLPVSEGMLVTGKRHLIAAPRKEGKSLGMLVHWARMALEQAKVIVLDRENGADEYARRLDAIITAWGLARRDKTRLHNHLDYYEFPRLGRTDAAEIAELGQGAAVVVFDSQRMFLTDFGLKESESDDYSQFMQFAIEPLFQAGVATVILDNTGHNNRERSRGTSAKGDLNEVLFTLKTDVDFSRNRQGKLRLTLAPGDSRFGNEGQWEMHIGGGAFSPWQRLGDQKPIDPVFRRAAEDALQAAGSVGLSKTKLIEAIRAAGVSFGHEVGRRWLYELAHDPDVSINMFAPEKDGLAAMFYGGRSVATA
jgi:hypothetical protein